jgi:glycosyltransferase involved in cell wall biosynthesis
MILSIVSGTYNRLQYLKLMILSVRQQLPKGIAYDIILVDGGSNDGTQAWCAAQSDITLIEDGALLGAISAFSRGAQAARGEYVTLANDDVIFQPFSLITALAYLETHASCAAVAFADNRTGIVFGDPTQYRTEGIGVTLADGTQTMRTYAQVGMFRQALAAEAGWWGWRDPMMQNARTYGGDSYLSARLWEAGYTVDAVEGCAVTEMVIQRGADGIVHGDALHAKHEADGRYYYERFPTVNVPAERAIYPVPERLRFLHLPIYEWNHPQADNREAGLTEAFADYGICLELDYLNAKGLDIPALVKAWQPDVVLTQMQGWGSKLTPQMLADMRQACPTAVIVNFNGDAHERGLIDSRVFDLLRHIDLQTTVNAKVLPVYRTEQIPAAYWQIYYKEPVDPLPQMPHHDLLFQGNWYEYRTDLFDVLHHLRVDNHMNVGIYGNDRRANGNTHHDFAAQAALYANATINIGDTFPGTVGFISNRVLQCLGAGGFLLLQTSPHLEEFTGLISGVHYAEWSDLSDLISKIDWWLQPDRAEMRATIAAAGQAFVRQNYSAQAQVRKLLTEIIPAALMEREYA